MVEIVAEVLAPERPVVVPAAPAVGDVTPRKCDMPEACKPKGKSRVTNGSRLLPDVPGTNPWVRRCRDIITGYIEQLNGSATVAERAVIRRIAVLETELERRESLSRRRAKLPRALSMSINEPVVIIAACWNPSASANQNRSNKQWRAGGRLWADKFIGHLMLQSVMPSGGSGRVLDWSSMPSSMGYRR
jgi:hypothetical protein